MVTVVVQQAHSDLQQLYCYVLGHTEWDCAYKVVTERGAGVVVLDLDETIIQQYPFVTVRNGWGRFCQSVFRGGRDDKWGPHKYFRIYLCTRTTGEPEKLWYEHLAPAANGRNTLPPVDKPLIRRYAPPQRGEWEHKSLKDVLTVYSVERHCAVIFDDKGREKEILEGPDPEVVDNWDESDSHALNVVPSFHRYTSEEERSKDMALPMNGEWLRLARIKFVEALESTGKALLSRREVKEMRNLAGYMHIQVREPTSHSILRSCPIIALIYFFMVARYMKLIVLSLFDFFLCRYSTVWDATAQASHQCTRLSVFVPNGYTWQ